jgi:hypothetical protein
MYKVQIPEEVKCKLPIKEARSELGLLEGMLSARTIRGDSENCKILKDRISKLRALHPNLK